MISERAPSAPSPSTSASHPTRSRLLVCSYRQWDHVFEYARHSAPPSLMPNTKPRFPATPRTQRTKNATALGTLAWLISRYRESAVWQALAPATRRKRERSFRHALETAGNKPFIRINTAVINDGLERRATTPAQARNFLDAMRGIFRWAVKNNHVKIRSHGWHRQSGAQNR